MVKKKTKARKLHHHQRKWYDVLTKPTQHKPVFVGSVQADNLSDAYGKARKRWWFDSNDSLTIQEVKVPHVLRLAVV